MAELFLLAISAALVHNVVLTYFLGICPFLGVSQRLDMAFGMGAAVTFVMVLAGTMTNLLFLYVLIPLGLTILQYLVFILVIASAVQLVEMYLRKFFPRLYDAFGVFLPMITTNCAILGTCLFINLKGYQRLDETLVYSFFAGMGFTLAIVIMASIREELEYADVPAPFRGAPIALFVAAILAMAFMGFAGIGSAN
jgi:Na+-translocating ferredoxin:NAD+ oxidoreductase subunit A